MVVLVGGTRNKKEYQALNTDLGTNGKPKEILKPINTSSTYHVVDNGKVFVWHVDAWYEI